MYTPSSPLSVRAAMAALLLALCAGQQAYALPGGGKVPKSIIDAQSDTPPQVRGVDVEEHLGDLAPLEAQFTDASGKPVRLRDVLPRTRPVLLTLVYYNCPLLCNLVINEQIRTMRELGLELGKDYEAVTVSIDPKDTPAQSHERRRKHLQSMGLPETAPWHFLTGTEENIHQLADTVGFKYTYDTGTQQYVHPAVLMVLTPEGGISRYLYGTSFPAKDMKLALLEAAGGRVGTSFDRIVLTCFKYDTATRRYGFYIFGFLRIGALMVFSALATMLAYYWRRELKKGAAA
ncbi:protein SCO1/2 [Archangium gephyra]|uniref:Cytochrome oxidase biogenesis protein Sco1/SenC/PrrC, putative copper metallochaperone n=1 Tax=Archangium gephyra TaxID=48 RepID=A0AAC8QGQ2_9BACT|nr:Cytochrome oxidase biogenesis protein Sco1/SenC/PrrC, putative copper metallochaperone [Archangium gephyra]REG26566.1 protein SCO1/2 [Archangium gephyra]